jgi:condensin complex subunit 1
MIFNRTGFHSEISSTAQDLEGNDQDEYLEHKQPLETYGFLILWIISLTEQKATSRAVQQEKAAGKATVSFVDHSDDYLLE